MDESPSFEKESKLGYSNLENMPNSQIINETEDRQTNSNIQSKEPVLNYAGDVQDFERGKDLFFSDGVRRIDFIMVWLMPKEKDKRAEQKVKERETFMENLIIDGLDVEEDIKDGREQQYTKIHAPFDLLLRYADLLKIRMPIKEKVETTQSVGLWEKLYSCAHTLMSPFHHDPCLVPPVVKRYCHPFEKEKIYLYDIPDNQDEFFSRATRCQIVDFVMRRTEYTLEKQSMFNFGIKNLLANHTYAGAFPLHEGSHKAKSLMSMRKLLYQNWASPRNWYKVQPLHYIRLYFGERIGFYFAWLGYYTYFLLFASIVGLIVFIYGIFHIYTDPIAAESCDKSNRFVMCPKCYRRCGYWGFHRMCYYILATHLFDNPATVFFAAFMALWGTIFLEFWKREQASIQFLWNLKNYEEEEETPRPEYLVRISESKFKRMNPITSEEEPYFPFWRKRLLVYLTSASIMIFLVLVLLAVVVGITIYRISVLATLYMMDSPSLHRHVPIIVSVTAAVINLFLIFFLNMIYEKLAMRLTEWECLRTQQEHDNSLRYKIYILQFVNYYSSLIYIAFLKGRFSGTPADFSKMLGARLEECEGGSCLTELCIQLAIIFIGKQLLKNMIEIILPRIKKCIKHFRTRGVKKVLKPWEKDYTLSEMGSLGLLQEYLEMMIQFGFVTLFVAAFPLAPIFALINNFIELRSDANRFLTQYRRPMPAKALSIGVWQDILHGLTRLSIITNACLIAFTSSFIQRELYRRVYSPTGTLVGFVNNSLSYFDVNDFLNHTAPDIGVVKPKYANTTICRYLDYRYPWWHENKYKYTQQHWHVVAAQFIFVVLFENLVLVVTSLAAHLIPDISSRVAVMKLKEALVVGGVVLKTELNRAKGLRGFLKVGELDRILRRSSADFVDGKRAKEGGKSGESSGGVTNAFGGYVNDENGGYGGSGAGGDIRLRTINGDLDKNDNNILTDDESKDDEKISFV